MLTQDFSKILNELGLTQGELAKLLSINIRTVRRWTENPKEVPGPAKQVLHAWLRLHRIGMPWRPDGVEDIISDPEEIAEQIKLYRYRAIKMDDILERVKKRGGPAAPWQVDLKKQVAILGPVKVWFCRLSNDSFSPSTYSRTDCVPDLNRDKTLIEDAFACISYAIGNQRKQK